MDPHQNPYTPGAGVRPPRLVGRDAEIKDFGVAFKRLAAGQSARSFVLDGLRGVGKTVVLNEADTVARAHGWVSSGVLECNEDDDLPLLMARLCHRALRRLSTGRRVGAAAKRALGVLRAFTFAMDEHGAWRFNIDVEAVTGVADSGDAEADIVELLAEVGAAAAQHGSGAAFLLDELQFLGKRSLATLAAAMHGISQQNAPVLLIAAGLPQLPMMLKNAKPYTERLFDYRTIGSLPRATAATALTVPAERARATFDQDALDLILDRADGYPYFLQQWGETVWREAEGPAITLRDAEVAEELVNDELDRRFFRDRYERATEAERIYMAAMADLGDGRQSSGEIAKRLGMVPKELSVRRAGLIEKGLIFNPAGTQLDFTVPQFAAYLRRVHPFDPEERPTRGRPRRA
ncbi:MAG: ATP-binding protein [Solirubrobacteraceae bacterium]